MVSPLILNLNDIEPAMFEQINVTAKTLLLNLTSEKYKIKERRTSKTNVISSNKKNIIILKFLRLTAAGILIQRAFFYRMRKKIRYNNIKAMNGFHY